MTGRERKSFVKAAHNSTARKEAEKQNLWPDLPQQLINLIARNSSMMKDLYSKGVTKSWRTQSTKCRSNSLLTPPWLQLSADHRSEHTESNTFNIPFRIGSFWYCCYQRPNLVGCHFLGCSHGILIFKGCPDSGNFTLQDPYPCSAGWWNIPSWDAKVPFLSVAVSAYPDKRAKNWRKFIEAKSIVMVLTGISHPTFVYYRIWEGKEWIKKDSNIVDPHCSDPSQPNHLFRFCNGIWCEEKFYALSVQGTLVVIEDINSDFRITRIGKRAVPSVASKHHRECMIESGGKILIVFLISRNSVNKVDYVEVYQLDTADLTWIKKESLGDLAVFFGDHCCMKVSAKRVGCKRNCIYFSICSGNGWWVYDMETGIILPVEIAVSSRKFLDWVDPELH